MTSPRYKSRYLFPGIAMDTTDRGQKLNLNGTQVKPPPPFFMYGQLNSPIHVHQLGAMVG